MLITILIYTGVYFARSPWRSSVLTMIFAVKNLLVVFLIGQVVASIFLGSDYWGRDWFRIADYYLCGTAYAALAILLWRMQSHDIAVFRSEETEARAEQKAREESL
ncbi:UNVERIFIED_CONTAM: hypothetical protein DES50_102769 [Williamsia faeni]